MSTLIRVVPPIDIIIPVFRGFFETQRCIESVLAAPVQTDYELVVIDDCSPEPALVEYLNSLSDQGLITLLHNAENIGFVATVNRGMQLHPDRDVLLLNSDTEVANDWLDRMVRAANSYTDIGTVTPFSNNATIFSYPFPSCNPQLIEREDLAFIDLCFNHVNKELLQDIPTAVGFCMLIRRVCLDVIGYFDVEVFGMGYGEECDFSRRAIKQGWRNLLACDVFVYHAGGVSFGAQRQERMYHAELKMADRHPDYPLAVTDFCDRDPLKAYRMAVSGCIFENYVDLKGRLFLAFMQLDSQMDERVRVLLDEQDTLTADQRYLQTLLDEARSSYRETDEALGEVQSQLRQAYALISQQELTIQELGRVTKFCQGFYRPLKWLGGTRVGHFLVWMKNKFLG